MGCSEDAGASVFSAAFWGLVVALRRPTGRDEDREGRLAMAGKEKRSGRGMVEMGGAESAVRFPEVDDSSDREIGLRFWIAAGEAGCGAAGGEDPVADCGSHRIDRHIQLSLGGSEHPQVPMLQAGHPLGAHQGTGDLHDLHQP